MSISGWSAKCARRFARSVCLSPQGQGRALHDRTDPSQGRQEEVTVFHYTPPHLSLRAQQSNLHRSAHLDRDYFVTSLLAMTGGGWRQEMRVSARCRTCGAAARTPAFPVAPQGRWTAAAVGVPLGQAHLRAGDRQSAGPHVGRCVVDRQNAARGPAHRADKAAAAAVGKLVAERAVAAGSRKWCSIAAPISITAASRRWPMRP